MCREGRETFRNLQASTGCYNPLKALFFELLRRNMRLNRKLTKILHILQSYDPEFIHLFGSWARGDADETSDVDLVVIIPSALPFLARMQQIGKSLPPNVGAIDLLVYTPEEWNQMLAEGNAFAETIAEEGKLLYDRQAR